MYFDLCSGGRLGINFFPSFMTGVDPDITFFSCFQFLFDQIMPGTICLDPDGLLFVEVRRIAVLDDIIACPFHLLPLNLQAGSACII